jgi:asparagine synthase (glutamine-hydrolysing)
MSGLAALFHRDSRPADLAAVRAMLDTVPYRGPDGMHARMSGSLALGHARLVVTPEDVHETQPLLSPRTGCAIIADVRLDNRADLLARLPGADRPASTAGDAEVILRCYEVWGVDALPLLLGDFAFVLWDPRLQTLVCARDTSGQRSLFYRFDHRTFAAASEIQQLLQDPSVPIAPNQEKVKSSLLPLNMFRNPKDDSATFYQGIHAVPAGHVLLVGPETLTIRRYWELEPPAEIRYRGEDEYAEHFRSLFFEIVQARLRSIRPVGALLSGGLDSTSVVCTAQELYRAGLAQDHGFTSISLVFDGHPWDESDLIRDVQRKYGFKAQYLTQGQFLGRLQLEPSGFLAYPGIGNNAATQTFLETAASLGVRALLTGDVADACVAGSPLVFDSLLRQGKFSELLRRLRAHRRATGASIPKTLARHGLLPLLPVCLLKRLMLARIRRSAAQDQSYLLPDWMPDPLRHDLAARHVPLQLEEEQRRCFASPAREAEYRLLYPAEMVNHAGPWPVEMWRPFADRRLHEFLLAVPPEQKFAPHPRTHAFYAGSKQLVRRGMRGIVPDSIRMRTLKTTFNDALHEELGREWPIYESVFGPSAESRVAARGYVDKARFWTRLQALRDGERQGDLLYVLQMIDFEHWLRTLEAPRSQLLGRELQ